MGNKAILIGAGVVLVITVLAFVAYRTPNDAELFQQALDGKNLATCTLSKPNSIIDTEEDDAELKKVEYYFDEERVRTIYEGQRTENGSKTWTYNTLVKGDTVQSWVSNSQTGNTHTLNGPLHEYLNSNMIDQETFKEAQGSCDSGAPDESEVLFEPPEDINFSERAIDIEGLEGT